MTDLDLALGAAPWNHWSANARRIVDYSAAFLNASEAAKRLGVSAKALRLYEHRGLIRPARTAAGWRVYGPGEMARAAEIVSLRGLGFSLAQVAHVLGSKSDALGSTLAAHQGMLERRIRETAITLEKVRGLRAELDSKQAPVGDKSALCVAFDLPWPWGGERFDLRDIRPLNYITGPLGSGKTRLARRLADVLPDAAFLGLERLENGAAISPVHKATLASLVEEGAVISDALLGLLAALESARTSILIVDMPERGLTAATQRALIAYLRRRATAGARTLFLLTRSTAILDLDAMTADETIIFCPANHNAPFCVAPYPGTPGYEALSSCLAPPDIRARTEGMIAWLPHAA